MNNLGVSNNNENFVYCDRIKIKLLNNYGNLDYIGLIDLEIYDDINDEFLSIDENFSYIKINQKIRNDHEKQILNNFFNVLIIATSTLYVYIHKR